MPGIAAALCSPLDEDSLHIPSHLRNLLNQSIPDYFFNNTWHFTLRFCTKHWNILEKILLYSMGPDNSDKIIWPTSPLGNVTAKIAYNHLRQKHPTVRWGKWIWSSFIPPRKSFPVWRAINDKLPLWNKLHFTGPICLLCFKTEETIDYLFVTCDFALQIWLKTYSAFNISITHSSSFGDLCIAAMKLVFSPQILSLWRSMFINIIWYIWNARNKFIFENIRPSSWFITASLWADLQETNKLSIGHMYNSQDDLICLHSLHLRGHPKKSPRIVELQWMLPPPGWVKCNTDGSALGTLGLAKCGGVFRNCRGVR